MARGLVILQPMEVRKIMGRKPVPSAQILGYKTHEGCPQEQPGLPAGTGRRREIRTGGRSYT